MKQQFGLIRRPWGTYYLKNKVTGEQTSLKTKDKEEAVRLLNARNDASSQPQFSLALARVYINGADPKLATRTWQDVIDDIVAGKKDATLARWKRAAKDKHLDSIRNVRVTETRAEHFTHVLNSGTVATNGYLRAIHNHAINMEWMLKSIIPKKQWPRQVFKDKRAITLDEHTRIVAREKNPELKALYQLLWYIGASQSDMANLKAENIDWDNRVIIFERMKLHGRGKQPPQIRFEREAEVILRSRPATGPLFPQLSKWMEKHRAKEFKRRCVGLGITGVTLHSYRYAWAERALVMGYPERFAQQALGHNSKAVHRAYSKRAKVIVPSLDDWAKSNKVVAVNFQSQPEAQTAKAANG